MLKASNYKYAIHVMNVIRYITFSVNDKTDIKPMILHLTTKLFIKEVI